MAAFQFPDPLIQQTVVNPVTGSTYQWQDPPGKWVVTVKAREVSDIIWEGDDPPFAPGYKLWYSTDTLELYFYYCDGNGVCAWIPTSKPITLLDDLDSAVSELRTDLYQVNIATAENENRIGRTVEFSDTAPTIYPDDIFDGVSYPSELNFKFWYDTARLELLILFRDADGDDSYVPVSIPLEALPDPGVSTEVFTYTTGRLQTAIEENYLHNLAQDTSIDGLKNDIIELEEEIDAIAPSVERGKWRFTAVGTVANPGQFTMYDADFGSGQPTGLFKNVKSIWFNQQDSEGVVHGFADVDDGELLQIFIENSAEFALFEVVGQAHDETQGATSFWVVDVNFVRTNEDTTAVAPSELCRFKVFFAPTGGSDAEGFVLRTGDTMTGDLSIDKSANGPAAGGQSGKEATLTLKGDRTGATNAVATIAFSNASSDLIGYLTYRSEKDGDTKFFKFNHDLELTTKLKTNDITTRSGDTLTFDKKLDFTNTSVVNARYRKGFVVKQAGQSIDGSNIFTAYNDYVEYDGPTNADNRIANRKWIWANTVRDWNTDSNWGMTAGLYVNSKDKGKVNNPGGSLINKHAYEFLVSASGYGSFFVIGNDACVRNDMYVNCRAENDNPKGNKVATVSSSRSMMSGMRQAILGATDFADLKSRLLAKLDEMENSAEFSEDPTTDDSSDSGY